MKKLTATPDHTTTDGREIIADYLLAVVVKHDRLEAKKRGYNPNALGMYCKGLGNIKSYLHNGYPLRLAILNCFNGRLLDKLLRSVALPVSTSNEQFVGGYEKLPELDN